VVYSQQLVAEYLQHFAELGEVITDHDGIYGYSIGITEPRMPLYEYPDYDFGLTGEITNLG